MDALQTSYGASQQRKPKVFESLIKFNNLEPAVQKHLHHVYSLLAATLGTCALGVYLSIKDVIHVNLILSQLVSLGIILYLAFTSYSPQQNQKTRMVALLCFGLLEGTQLSPLIQMALELNPNIVFLSVVSTTLLFVCFSAAALLSERRSFLYLGGFLFSSISYLLLIALFGPLFGLSELNYVVQVYGGLVVFMLYIIYDTQMIVEKASWGEESRDVVTHSLELFVDFIAIFIRILILLSKKERSSHDAV